MAPLISGKGRGLQFGIDLGSATSKSGRLQTDEPIEILMIADCSGRRARAVSAPLAGRRARAISVDNLDTVFAAWNAQVDVQLGGLSVSLAPRTLEDLHPEQLLRSVAPLRELSELKRKLDDPSAVERLTSLLGQMSAAPLPAASAPREADATPAAARMPDAEATTPEATTPEATTRATADQAGGAGEGSDDLLSRLLGAPTGTARPSTPAASTGGGPARQNLDGLIRSIVGNAGITSGPSGTNVALDSAAELELGRLLRGLLRSAPFRALESTWHGIDTLCRNCPDEELVRFKVVDASLAELLADLGGFGALLEAQRPSVVVVDDYVDASAEELSALQRLLGACSAQGAILVLGASARLAGYAGFSATDAPPEEIAPPPAARAAWQELTQARAAGAQLALALPRCLLRQPYGKMGEPLDRLEFEEVLDADHEAFVWGNGGYLVARALAVRHAGGGTQMDGSVELRELPVVRLPDEDGYRLQPSGEAWLSERAVERLRAAGFAVLQGVRDSDRLRVHV